MGKLQAKVGTIGRFPLPITIGVGGGDVLPSTSLCEGKVVSITSTLLNSTTAEGVCTVYCSLYSVHRILLIQYKKKIT